MAYQQSNSNQGFDPNRYPRFNEQWQARRPEVEQEVEQWYAQNADRNAQPEQGWLEQAGDRVGNFFSDMKQTVKGWFDSDKSADEPTRAEYDKALNDDEYWRGQLGECVTCMQQEGRFGVNRTNYGDGNF